jgi:hypothetical protein
MVDSRDWRKVAPRVVRYITVANRSVKCGLDPPRRTHPLADAAGLDAIIWGQTTSGRSFRPSDWADRLAGLTAAFGHDQKLMYSPLVCPVSVRGVRAVIVAHQLAELEPRLYQFLLNFARDNELEVAFAAGAIDSPRGLLPPGMAPAGTSEPREPV